MATQLRVETSPGLALGQGRAGRWRGSLPGRKVTQAQTRPQQMHRLLARTLNVYKGLVSGGRPEGVRTGADMGDPGAGSAPTSSLPVAPETGQGRRGETGLDPGTWGMCALHRDEGQVPDQGVGRATWR